MSSVQPEMLEGEGGGARVALRVALVDPDRLAFTGELLDSEVRRSDDHALIMLAGELDTSTVGALYKQLADLAALGVRHVALNLAELTFMDSTGLSVVVSEHKRVESMGGELIIFSPCPGVRRLFEITGLSHYLNVRPVRAAMAPGATYAPPLGPVKGVSVSLAADETGADGTTNVVSAASMP